MTIPPVNLAKLENLFAQLDIQGVRYGLGAKAEGSSYAGRQYNPRSTGHLTTPPQTIDHIDCSGWTRYGLFNATGGKLILPDGSQAQREWCENNKLHKVNYPDTNRYLTARRLFIAFIKPFANNCGPVGHVWFVTQYDADSAADTLESHGGVGINSRAWNYPVLRQQVYSCYELPTK